MNDPTPFLQHRRPSGGRLVAVAASISDTELVHAARAGDRRAFSTLFERWFDRSYDVAWRIVRNPETAAEVAQDTFLVAWQKLDSLRDADAFGGWILRTARNRALNRLERDGRSRAFDTDDTVAMVDRERSALDVADEIVRQEQHDLVWAAAAALGERDASILDLHLRHDLDPGQIAEALDITPNAAHQTLFRLRKRLEGAIRSYVLWHDGRPECGELAQALDTAGITSFGPAAVKTISAHVASCEACDERHATVLAPASMFAAVPLVAVGLDVRRAAAAQLASHGVPIDPELVGNAPSPAPDPGTGGTTLAVAESGGEAGATPRRYRAVAAGAVAAVLLVVAAVVVGAGLLEGGDSAEIDLVAAPGTTEGAPRVLGTVTVTTTPSTTTDELTDPADPDAPPASTEPPLVEPPTTGAPDPTDPPTTTSPPPATTRPDPSTTSSTGTTSSTTDTTVPPAAPEPVVRRFAAINEGAAACGRGSTGNNYRLVWSVADADSVTLTGTPEVAFGPHPPIGELVVCVPAGVGGTWQLTATGPGGSVDAFTSTT
jgi:RNA polymerase sigma factor (sigma-70 family)